jgi:hypothetical protein
MSDLRNGVIPGIHSGFHQNDANWALGNLFAMLGLLQDSEISQGLPSLSTQPILAVNRPPLLSRFESNVSQQFISEDSNIEAKAK